MLSCPHEKTYATFAHYNIHSLRSGDPNARAYEISNSNPYSNPYPNSYSNPYSYPYSYPYSNSYSNPDL